MLMEWMLRRGSPGPTANQRQQGVLSAQGLQQLAEQVLPGGQV